MAGNPITKIIITAKDEASAVFTSLQAKVAAIATAISGYFGVKMFGEAIGSAMDFEAAMSRVQAASGASGAELLALQNAAEEAGATTEFTSTQAADALENLAKAGLTASQAVQALPAVLSLAQAGGVELGTAAEYVTKAVNGMGMSFSEAGRVADVLAMGANASNTSVEGLAGALSYAAPLAHSLGLSLEDTVAIIGKFADAGIDASRAGTALNSILSQFSDPTSKFRTALAGAGITTNDFNQALRELAKSGPAGQSAILAVGQEAGPALRALLGQGIGALDDLKAKLDNAQGSAAATASTMGNNLTGAMSGLSSAWDAVQRALVKPLLEPLAVQVNALSARFRAAVQDGTIGRFGDAIRIAFESGVKWVNEFVSKVDLTEVAARLQGFAAKTGEVFEKIGNHATTAGGVVQTAYGVMQAGVGVVSGAIFKVAEAFAGVTSNILSGVALITESWARVTFGDVSAKFAAVTAEIRTQAGAMWAVSQEFASKSEEAFASAGAGVQTAAEGWKTLSSAATETTAAATLAGDAVAAAGAKAAESGAAVTAAAEQATQAAKSYTELGISAQAAAEKYREISTQTGVAVTSMRELQQAVLEGRIEFDESGKAWKAASGELKPLAQRFDAADAAAGQFAQTLKLGAAASKVSTQSVAEMRAEYRRLVEAGDLQAAAQKLQQIEAAMKALGEHAAVSTEEVQAAFARLEVTSEATLKTLAQNAKNDFETIKNSGVASTRDIQAAFTAYAQKAIAANGGVVSSMLQVEASQNGLRVSATESGQVIVQSMVEAAFATNQVGAAAGGAASEFRDMANAASEAASAAKEAADDTKPLGTGARAGHAGWEDWTTAELNAVVRNRRNSPDLIAGAQAEIERRNKEWRAKQEEEERKRRERETGGGGSFTRPAPSGMQVERVVQINLVPPRGETVSVFAAPSSVGAVIAALESAAMRAN